MQTYETLKHTTWECKYHIVFIPKYRKKAQPSHRGDEIGLISPVSEETRASRRK